MSLTTCLKKMGKSLHAQDKADIYAAARKHRSDGLSAIEAARKAVADQLAKADARVSAEESAQRESNESGHEAPADAGVSRSEPLTRAEIDADVKRVFGTAKPLTRLINSGAVSLITKAQAIQRGLGSAKSLEGVKGLHDGTRGYLITDELQPNEVAGVLIHEIGVHHSMERILGAERFDKLQKAMESFRARGDKDVLAAYAAVPKDTPAHHVNHEAIAYLAEHSANHSITQKLVDATKLFLNRLGVPMSWIKAEPAAVRSIARESLLAESRRGNGSVRYNGRDTLYQKVWHGTPHRDIEKHGFKLNKIGTGEGAQAYGWGLYFAGDKAVAEWYREALGGRRLTGDVNTDLIREKYMQWRQSKNFTDDEMVQKLTDFYTGNPFNLDKKVPDLSAFIDKMVRDKGQLYHAEIPEDSDLLDYDKPLSEQPEKVRAALSEMVAEAAESPNASRATRDIRRAIEPYTRAELLSEISKRYGWEIVGDALVKPNGARVPEAAIQEQLKMRAGLANYETAGDIYRELAHIQGSDASISTALGNRGIPGLRYLDASSRQTPAVKAQKLADLRKSKSETERVRDDMLKNADTLRGKGFAKQADSELQSAQKWADKIAKIDADIAAAEAFEGSANYVIWDENLLTPEKAQITPYYSKRVADTEREKNFAEAFKDTKVVGEDGKPLRVYHGTTGDFDTFDSGKQGSVTRSTSSKSGFFFTDSPRTAKSYADHGATVSPVERLIAEADKAGEKGDWDTYDQKITEAEELEAKMSKDSDGRNRGQSLIPVYLNIKNPLVIDAKGENPQGIGGIDPLIQKAKKAGNDGVIIKNFDDSAGLSDDVSTHYIAFKPEQIKSAVGNSGAYDMSKPSILASKRTRQDAEREAAITRNEARNTLGGPTTGGAIGWNFDAGKWEGKSGTARRARAALDDKMIAWRDVQDSLAEHLGNTIPDAQNVYRLENLMHGRVKEGVDALEEKQIAPLVKAMQEAKITPAMLEEYLYALHAKERNAQIAKINPKMPDGGSGMTNAEADAILAKPLPNGMKSIAKRAQNLVRQTRQRLLDHGIITQGQFDAMESQYQNYVPLRGKTVGENEFDSGGGGGGRGIDGRPSPVKQAFGRGAGNRAENILGEIIGDAQRSIIAAEKARVGRAVMRIVLANPNPKLWTVEPVLTERKLDATGEVYEAVVQDWSDPSIVAVRHRGQVYKVQINHAPLAKALNLVGVDQIGAVTRAAGALNRYFSAVLTRYNPAFIPVNAARDALFGLTGLAVEHGEVTAMKAALYYPKAIRAAWREARRLPPKSQADTYAREFSEDGGKTGYVSMPSVEELQRKIGSGRFGGYSPQGIGRAAQAVGDLVGAMNDSVENALRLSAYVTLREQGMAREKAASYAKELTVNFNRKGSEGTKLNSWFLFYNASMQGIKRTGALMKSPKTWGYLGALTAAQIAAVMYAMGQEDDDGTPIWDKVPDHVKQRNLVFTWLDDGGEQKILTIPMPYGLNVFPYFAGRVADGMMHAENRPRDRAMSIAADTVSTAVQSFSPVPLDDGAMGLLPTALRIPLSIQVNRDDFGRQIRKENPFGKFDVPRASIGKPDTLEMFKVMATGLNRIGGGDERTPPPMSAFDVAPEDIEYVLEKLGGGTGKFIIDMATVGQKSTGELPVEARDIPIAKRFFTNVNEPAAQQAMFYERREAIERDADMVRDVYEKDGPEAAIALLRSTPSLSGADFRRYKESDPKKGHRKGGIVVVDGRPQLVVRRPDSVYGRYKAAAEETAEVNESMRNAYADSPMSLRPSGERDKRLKELADKRMAAQRIFNAAWNRDVVGGE